MTVAALDKEIVLDDQGNPQKVIIPYEQFVDFVETYGLDLTEEERAGLQEANSDLVAGNEDAFVSFDEVKKELGLDAPS